MAHDHDHDHGGGLLGKVKQLAAGHSHDPAQRSDAAQAASRQGMRALSLSLAGLGLTALAELVVVIISGSVGLLGDTLHNFADALTALPLGVAFILGRRSPTGATPTATAAPKTWPAWPSWPPSPCPPPPPGT